MTKYTVAVNFAVLFENISITIKHTIYMIPGYRSTWLISYTANMTQKREILINRLMECNFSRLFQVRLFYGEEAWVLPLIPVSDKYFLACSVLIGPVIDPWPWRKYRTDQR